jgi:hypothetical protein
MEPSKRPVWRGLIAGSEHAIVSRDGELQAWPSYLGGSKPSIVSRCEDDDPLIHEPAGLAFFLARATSAQIAAGLWTPAPHTEHQGDPWVVSTRESAVRCAFRGALQVIAASHGVRVATYSPNVRTYSARAALDGECLDVPATLCADLLWRWFRGA